KMELLAQAAPVIILGVVWRRLTGQAALTGVVAGTTLALILTFLGYGKIWGFHAGLLGLGLNVGCCISLTLLNRKLP
ncbi:sodium:solute symporter family protein, partial [candidate division KSB1 bacterium]|nr:sodium:solute symporter family protein [candidate division KSB1 bacterium]